MRQLGFERFAVAGHDRGGRVRVPDGARPPGAGTQAGGARHRPDRRDVARAPTWRSASATGTGSSWRSRRRCPERLIGADPDAYYFRADRDASSTRRRSPTTSAASTTRRRSTPCARTTAPARRSTSRSTRPIAAQAGGSPARCWRCGAGAARSSEWYDVLAIWRDWADDVRGRAIDCGHYLAEEAPEEMAVELSAFFARD